MAHEVIIRDVRPEDVEAIVDIAVAAWEPINAYRRDLMGDELFAAAVPDWRGRKARDVRSACAGGSTTRVCVAEEDGQVVGFVTFYVHEASGIGEIGNNAVHPSFRGRGIATAMYRHAFEKLQERGMRFVRAGTGGDPAHAPARRAYERAGFSLQIPYVHYYRKL